VEKWIRFKSLLARPVDSASLAFFRMAVGLVMMLEAWSLLRPSASTNGRIMLETYYTGVDVTCHFPYAWFEWLPVLPKNYFYGLVIMLGVAGAFLAAGLFYRISAALVFLIWGYLYAIECTRTYWMSYYYLELLTTFLLIWMPAARSFSLDSMLFKAQRSDVIPFWPIALLRGQLVITYFYAGLAKVNADWLLDAMPVREFLVRSPFLVRYGKHLSSEHLHFARSVLQSTSLAYFLSWAGALFDLSIGGLLLWPRTRFVGFLLMLFFHGFNHFILFDNIIWFPLLGVLTSTIFLPPNWPRAVLRRLGFFLLATTTEQRPFLLRPAVAVFVVVWLAAQTLIPLRHYAIPGDGRFTWEGLSFSWRLKTDWYQPSLCEISLQDSSLVITDTSGISHIDWSRWRREKVLYRIVVPEKIDWAILPKIVVLSEPELGERIIYNPLSGNPQALPGEMEIRTEVNKLWQDIYGRSPAKIQRTVPPSEIAAAFASVLRSKGAAPSNNEKENLEIFRREYGANGNGKGMATLRRIHPFGFENVAAPAAPFMLIEDPLLFKEAQPHSLMLNRDTWKTPEKATSFDLGALTVYTLLRDVEDRRRLPAICLVQPVGSGQEPAHVSWDPLRDISLSQAMHISTNPFLLQRYASRVADLWQKETGSRPKVFAKTAVSLNFRPAQCLVSESSDLAKVHVTHWWHNSWICQLAVKRIPDQIH
jgi:vitamin K-dependent gamma-carboxylase